jgi:hypothetical protein
MGNSRLGLVGAFASVFMPFLTLAPWSSYVDLKLSRRPGGVDLLYMYVSEPHGRHSTSDI